MFWKTTKSALIFGLIILPRMIIAISNRCTILKLNSLVYFFSNDFNWRRKYHPFLSSQMVYCANARKCITKSCFLLHSAFSKCHQALELLVISEAYGSSHLCLLAVRRILLLKKAFSKESKDLFLVSNVVAQYFQKNVILGRKYLSYVKDSYLSSNCRCTYS